MAIIKEVSAGSISEEIGIEAGDELLAIDGQPIDDILDYQFYTSEDRFILSILKRGGEQWDIDIEKNYDEELGIIFDDFIFDQMRRCKNKCLFCFIDQLPEGMRSSLYTKDDDYRYSFLYGNFITLTNLTEKDWDKIIRMRLSPLYVSVHCMDPQIRAMMLNNKKAGPIKEQLLRLKEAGIKIHTQIVLCPGINDGRILADTIEELAGLYPAVQSIGIVPVGLSGHRENLTGLSTFTAGRIIEIISMIDKFQSRFREEQGCGLVYLADEFYISAGRAAPAADYYDDFPQTENGIGLARILLDQFAELEPGLPQQIKPRTVYLITGFSALPIIDYISQRLNKIKGLKVAVLPVPNHYFGGSVTVTGLLTGSDIIDCLGSKFKDETVIIPRVVLKEGEDVLLDDVTISEISAQTGARILLVGSKAIDLINAAVKGV